MAEMKTMRVLGFDFPVIKELRDGWHLVAVERGPAIAKVWDGNTDGGLIATLGHSHEEIPEEIRTAAIEAFVELAFPGVKTRYYPNP